MKQDCEQSNSLEEIDSIYLTAPGLEEGFFKKSVVYDYLHDTKCDIFVNIYPYPKLQPVISKNGEKYVRSTANMYGTDNLLCLPRK